MLSRSLNIEEIQTIITENIYNRFKLALASDTEVLNFEYNGYMYRNNGNGVIIRKGDDYISSINISKDAFKGTYTDFLNRCINK